MTNVKVFPCVPLVAAIAGRENPVQTQTLWFILRWECLGTFRAFLRTKFQNLPRIEGCGKVTGQTKYAADLEFPGLLWAKVLRSSLPHARIVKVDGSRAKSLPGIHAVVTGADVKGIYVGSRLKDQSLLHSGDLVD